MKTAVYESLCAINQGFGAIPEHLERLRDLGVITAEYVESQRVLSEELRAGINYNVTQQITIPRGRRS
jgi:hypothetical protein